MALVAGALALVLAGCGTTPEVPSDQYFRITVATPQPLPRPVLPGIVSVERLSANGLTGGRPIVYARRDQPTRLNEYHYQLWIEPPTSMVRDLLVEYLRQANAAQQVVTPDLRVEPNSVVRGRILRFEQIVGSPPGVAVEIELSVQDVGADTIRHIKTYRVERRVANETIPAAVDAFGAALSEIFAGLVKALAGT